MWCSSDMVDCMFTQVVMKEKNQTNNFERKKIIKQIILRSLMVSVKSGKWLIFEAFWFQAWSSNRISNHITSYILTGSGISMQVLGHSLWNNQLQVRVPCIGLPLLIGCYVIYTKKESDPLRFMCLLSRATRYEWCIFNEKKSSGIRLRRQNQTLM